MCVCVCLFGAWTLNMSHGHGYEQKKKAEQKKIGGKHPKSITHSYWPGRRSEGRTKNKYARQVEKKIAKFLK